MTAEKLIADYPALSCCVPNIDRAAEILINCYKRGNKLLLCGNGGSCADSEHITGELLKGFLKKRPLSPEQKRSMKEKCPELADGVLEQLQNGLPAISLCGLTALNTAFANDVNPRLIYAQSLLALSQSGDVFWGISTSGNAENVCAAARVARGLGLTVLGLTGQSGGTLKTLSDICICVPETETYKVQELHLPVYHALCTRVEDAFFRE